MRMPGMSGLDLQQKLASMGLHPPIIMISGHGEIPNAVQAVQSGAIDFLQKPVSDQLLLDRIQQALDRTARSRRRVAVLSCELDRFKVVNDSIGYVHGDAVLVDGVEGSAPFDAWLDQTAGGGQGGNAIDGGTAGRGETPPRHST